MNDFIKVQFDSKSSPAVKEPLLNSYGFDLRDENQIGFTSGEFRFTVMGFRPTTQYETLTATIKVARHPHVQDEYTHIERFDLFINDRLNAYCRTAAQQLRVNEAEVKKAMYSLRERLERYRNDEVKNINKVVKKVFVSDAEQKEVMNYLKSDNLMDSIEGLLKQAGLVTEMEKGLQLFFILLSRHFDKPLHVLFQGSPQLSRLLMETVGLTVPEEEIQTQTSMSASGIYYTTTRDFWKNKVLYLTSVDKQFKGASTIQEFIENGVLKRFTTQNDYKTGQISGGTKIVNGSICLMAYCEDDSINNRFFQECFVIRVNENETNRAELNEYHKMEFGGFTDPQERDEAIRQLATIQRFIKPVNVIIPYARELNLPDKIFQPLRSLPQLLTFIKSVALLHQYQLPKKRDKNGTEYIEASTEHLKIAIELFKSIAISQGDLLSQTQRNFIERLKNHVKDKDNSFKIPEAMKELEMSSSSFYRLFDSVKIMGYVMQSGGDKKKGIQYKITEWDDYTQLKDGADTWNEQLKKIKLSFPEDSQKFPKQEKKGKAQLKQVIQTEQN